MARGTLNHLDNHLQKKHVLSESARSETLGMTRDVLLISLSIRPFSCPAKHSKCNEYFWVSGKMYGVKSTLFFSGCSEVKVKVVKNRNSKVQIPQKLLK